MLEFVGEFCTGQMRTQKRAELFALKRGSMTVPEFDDKFVKLGRFVSELLMAEEDKMFHFLRGLNPELWMPIHGQRCVTLADIVRGATTLEGVMTFCREIHQKRLRKTLVVNQGGSSEGASKNSKEQHSHCSKCGQRHSRGFRCDRTPFIFHVCGRVRHIAPRCRARDGQRKQTE
ncbi:hypothetical protein Dimus_020428 [Dionaea muscipula]